MRCRYRVSVIEGRLIREVVPGRRDRCDPGIRQWPPQHGTWHPVHTPKSVRAQEHAVSQRQIGQPGHGHISGSRKRAEVLIAMTYAAVVPDVRGRCMFRDARSRDVMG